MQTDFESNTEILLFGGCHVRGPFSTIRPAKRRRQENGLVQSNSVSVIGPPFHCYTIAEMLQAMEILRGERYVPAEIRVLCGMNQHAAPISQARLSDVEAVLIEASSSIGIRFEGYALNRAGLLSWLNPLRQLGPEVSKLAGRWYLKGLIGLNEEIKIATAKELAKLIPSDYPDRIFMLAVLRNSIGLEEDVKASLAKLRWQFKAPVGVVAFTWQYMADGRFLSWPSEFYSKMSLAARDLSLPFFEPKDIVLEYGVMKAMQDDMRHYKPEFQPTIAKALLEFLYTVMEPVAA